MSQINKIIRERKSVYPAQYIDKAIPKEIINELLENANHAPTHKLTEPWRFKVFLNGAKKRLGDFLANKYQATTDSFSEAKYEKIQNNFSKAGAILAIILHRDPKESVPEWEEIASLGCAVQNIWISCNQYGLGGYWSTPSFSEYLKEFVSLQSNEKCLGFFYLGYHEPNDRIVTKRPITDKVEWLEG